LPDGLRRLGIGLLHQIVIGHRRHLDMDVNAVQERAGNFGTIAVNLLIGAAAGVFGVCVIPAWGVNRVSNLDY
jgi:hypothetical protein